MTRRLEEIDRCDPQIGYRPGRLQTALSHTPGQLEGQLASANRFLELEEEREGEGDREREGDVDRAHDDVDRAHDDVDE